MSTINEISGSIRNDNLTINENFNNLNTDKLESTNLKTINGNSIVGSGDLVVGGGDMGTSVYDPANGAKQVAFEEDVVPYTGATQDVDLDTHKLNAQSIHAKGTGGAGHLGLKHQSADITASTSESSLGANSSGNPVWKNDGNPIQQIAFTSDIITDHGGLGGLADDDHTQYHNDTRGDIRYYTKSELNAGQLNNLYYTETETDTLLSGKQSLDADLTSIAGLTPSNDDIIQRKAGAWVNRTMSQLKTDLSLTKSDVGLSNVVNADTTTTANITDSTNKRFITDAQQTILGNTSGTNTGDETTATIKTKLGITTLSGSNTGDQTITLTGDVTGSGTGSFATTIGALKVLGSMIANATIDLTTKVIGRLPFANLVSPSTTSILLGRGTTSGDYQEITLGTNLSMTGTTLNASSGGGGSSRTDLLYPHNKSGLTPFAKIVTNTTTYTPTTGKVGYITWARTDGISTGLTPILRINSIDIGLFAYVNSSGVGVLENPILLSDTDVISSSSTENINILGFEVDEDADITPICTSGSYTVPTGKHYVITNWYGTTVTLRTNAITVNSSSINVVSFNNTILTDMDSNTAGVIILGPGDSINTTNINHCGYLVPNTFIT